MTAAAQRARYAHRFCLRLSWCARVCLPVRVSILCNEPTDEFLLVSVVVLRHGAEQYKNLIREKRYIVRPFKFDPEEDRAERQRKVVLAKKKRDLWNFLIRWCTTTYTEVFTAWIHLKAIRLYVEAVLRYGLPYAAQSIIMEPAKQKVINSACEGTSTGLTCPRNECLISVSLSLCCGCVAVCVRRSRCARC